MTAVHLVLATVVTHERWQNNRADVLHAAQATLQQRARQQGVRLLDQPHEDVEVLPGGTRVRITFNAEGAPQAQEPTTSGPT